MGIGACLHQLKNYELASGFYLISATLDPLSPVPFYYMYNCFINLEDLQQRHPHAGYRHRKCADHPETHHPQGTFLADKGVAEMSSGHHCRQCKKKQKQHKTACF